MVDCHESSLVKQDGDWAIIERATVSQARSELSKEVRFVSALLDTASTMIVSVDREGRILRCNDRCTEVLGLGRDEIQGRFAWDVVAWPQDRVLTRLTECWEGEPCSFESSLPLSGDAALTVLWSTAPVAGEDGKTEFVVATGQDITLHREAESKLQEAYDAEHRVATTLQESLLRPVPDLAGVRVGVSYKPAVEAERVGGDFYDVYPLGDGRVAAVVGDVSGKGISAAGFTETVRSTLRALLYMGLTPAQALTQANRVLLDQMGVEQFATTAVALVDTSTGGVQYGSAGHPCPLVVGRRALMVDCSSDPPLGAFDHEFGQLELTLSGSDCLVMFTDGLTEARNGTSFFLDSLLPIAQGQPLDPDKLVSGLLQEAMGFSAGPISDDIAILALQLDSTMV